MSGMLRRLREQLRDPLMVRGKQGYELTARGLEIAEKTRQALLLINDLVTPPEYEVGKLHQHFIIMASEFSLFLILPQVFRQAQVLAPGVTFEIVPISDPPGNVYAGNVDLGMSGDTLACVEGEPANVVRTQVLFSDRFVGVVDHAHPLNGDVTLDQFLAYPHVVTQFYGNARTVEDNFISGLSQDHPPRIRVPSFLSIGPVVAGTNMIGLMPALLVPMLSSTSALKTLTPPAEIVAAPLRALWHARYDEDPAHRWLRALIVDACAVLKPSGGIPPQVLK